MPDDDDSSWKGLVEHALVLPDNTDTPDERTKITYFGYEKPGEPDYDSGSAAGLGDRQNSLVPGYSVALTQSERLARFGVSGKSTGQEFEYQGRRYRDDDSTSRALTDRRIDIYSPAGPGHLGSGGLTGGYGPDLRKESSDESLLARLRAAMPAFANRTDEDMLAEAQTRIAPELDKQEFARIARSTDWKTQLGETLNKKLTPLQKFKRVAPIASQMDDNELLTQLYDWGVKNGRLDPDTWSREGFHDSMVPPTGLQATLSGTVNLTKAGIHETAGKFYDIVAGVPDFLKYVSGLKSVEENVPGVGPMLKGAETSVLDNYQKSPDWFKSIVNWIPNAAKAEHAQAARQQAQAAQAKGIAGFAGQVVGGLAGQIPEWLLTGGLPEVGLTGRVLAAASFEGLAGWSKAAQAHQENAFLTGIHNAATAANQALIINLPVGRIGSGVLNAVMNTSEQEVENWAQGKPSSVLDITKAAAIDFGLGAIFANVPEKQRPVAEILAGLEKTRTRTFEEQAAQVREAQARALLEPAPPVSAWHRPMPIEPEAFVTSLYHGTEPPAYQGPWYFHANREPIGTRPYGGNIPYRKTFYAADPYLEEQLARAAQSGRDILHGPAVLEEARKAAVAKEAGNLDLAKEHLDNAVSLMGEDERTQHAQRVIEQMDATGKDSTKGVALHEDIATRVYGLSPCQVG